MHNGSYTFVYFFWILSTIKMKFGYILVYLIANISNMFCLHAGNGKLVPDLFRVLRKWQHSKICQVLGVDVEHFHSHLFTLSKKETLEPWPNLLLSNWSRLLNWKWPETQSQASKSYVETPSTKCLFPWLKVNSPPPPPPPPATK